MARNWKTYIIISTFSVEEKAGSIPLVKTVAKMRRRLPAQFGERRVEVRGGGGRQRLRALRRHADVLLQQPSATTPRTT